MTDRIKKLSVTDTPKIHIPPSPFMKKLGYGTGVSIYLMQKENFVGTHSPWAIKKVNEYGKEKNISNRIEWEAKLLKQLSHPNIVGYRGKFRENSSVVLALELCDTSLMDLLEKRQEENLGALPALTILSLAYEIVKGLAYLHSKFILHGDIKSSNILVDKDLKSAKLCDLGTALLLNDCFQVADSTAEYIGTPPWNPPEVFQQELELADADLNVSAQYPKTIITDRADIYAFGMVLYEMCTLSIPHDLDRYSSKLEMGNYEGCDSSINATPTQKIVARTGASSLDTSFSVNYGTRPAFYSGSLDDTYNQVLELFYACSEPVAADRPSAHDLVEIIRDCLPFTPIN